MSIQKFIKWACDGDDDDDDNDDDVLMTVKPCQRGRSCAAGL